MAYNEEDYLQLSGLQHFQFCRRQWALIHIENQWAENFRTADGEIFHSNAHDGSVRESRGDTVILRKLRVFSPTLGISGECDVVELRRDPTGISFPGQEGRFSVLPVEYKRGSPKENSADALQLCAQAICLEEMMCCSIPEGALYYGESRHRQMVLLTDTLRQEVTSLSEEMHALYRRGYTPKVKPTKSCNACSLKDLCLPKLMRKRSALQYIHEKLEDQG